jgi:hypothetical protein
MIGTIVVTEAQADEEEEAVEEGTTGEEESETPSIDENP